MPARSSIAPGNPTAIGWLTGRLHDALRDGILRAVLLCASPRDQIWRGARIDHAYLSRRLGMDPRAISSAIHRIKRIGGLGGADHVAIDVSTGDVYDDRTYDNDRDRAFIANIHEV